MALGGCGAGASSDGGATGRDGNVDGPPDRADTGAAETGPGLDVGNDGVHDAMVNDTASDVATPSDVAPPDRAATDLAAEATPGHDGGIDSGGDVASDVATTGDAHGDAASDALATSDAASDARADAGTPLFVLAARYGHGVDAVADVDGDGRVDMVLITSVSGGSDVSVWPGHGDGTFATTAVTTHLPGFSFSKEGDFTGDRRLDIISVTTPQAGTAIQFQIAMGQSDDAFGLMTIEGQQPSSVPVYAPCLGVGDVTGDGVADLVFVTKSSIGNSRVHVFHSGGAGGPVFAQTDADIGPLPGERSTIDCEGVGDFDGDHNGDIAVHQVLQGLSGPSVDVPAILYGKGDGTFGTLATADDLTLATGDFINSLGDYDGDGKTDLLILNDSTDQYRILWNDGNEAFSEGPSGFAAVVGDFDGDGHVDLLTSPGGVETIAFGDGARGFARTLAVPLFGATADVDGDGTTDIVSPNALPGGQPLVSAVYLSTAKHPFVGTPDIQCAVTPSSLCDGPTSF
ncbi:MAG TPA: VCBS repeat-containing protein [Polyangia bacterium]|nr:VCBS repeat-containing protein [Polyangia bacterium]